MNRSRAFLPEAGAMTLALDRAGYSLLKFEGGKDGCTMRLRR